MACSKKIQALYVTIVNKQQKSQNLHHKVIKVKLKTLRVHMKVTIMHLQP